MPIIDVEWVGAASEPAPCSAQALADAIGAALSTPPGRTWVRLRRLDADDYAENDAPVADDERPVFVTVQHAHAPQGEARTRELSVLMRAIAHVLQRASDRVHVRYAPSAAGQQAFGGRWVV